MLEQYSNVPTINDQFYLQPAFNYAPTMSAYAPVLTNTKKHIFNAPPKRSNALFIKNLPYNLTYDEFLKIFGQFGEIASISLHIKDRGIAFLTYYDLRAAEAAKNKLQGFNVYGRFPAIDYSYKPPNYSKVDPREYSSLIKVKTISNSFLSKEDVQKNLSIYGEINEIKDFKENNSKADHISFLVLFYDSRCAHKACAEGYLEINGIKCQCEVFVENDNSVIYSMKPPQKHQNNKNLQNLYPTGQIAPQNSYPSTSPHYQPAISATASGISQLYQPPSPPVPSQYPYQYGNITPPYYSQQPLSQEKQPMPQQQIQMTIHAQPINGTTQNIQTQNPVQNKGQSSEDLKATLMKLKSFLNK